MLNEISGEATDKSKNNNKGSRKKSKIDVKHLVSTSNKSRADMARAVTNLAGFKRRDRVQKGCLGGQKFLL